MFNCTLELELPVTKCPTDEPAQKPVTTSPTEAPTKTPVTESPTDGPAEKPVTEMATLGSGDESLVQQNGGGSEPSLFDGGAGSEVEGSTEPAPGCSLFNDTNVAEDGPSVASSAVPASAAEAEDPASASATVVPPAAALAVLYFATMWMLCPVAQRHSAFVPYNAEIFEHPHTHALFHTDAQQDLKRPKGASKPLAFLAHVHGEISLIRLGDPHVVVQVEDLELSEQRPQRTPQLDRIAFEPRRGAAEQRVETHTSPAGFCALFDAAHARHLEPENLQVHFHTFWSTRSDSPPPPPPKGKLDAHSGLRHSITFLIEGGSHSCPIRPNFAAASGPPRRGSATRSSFSLMACGSRSAGGLTSADGSSTSDGGGGSAKDTETETPPDRRWRVPAAGAGGVRI
ncbi:hypothetical protein ACHAWF_015860 [Thalassiosira exigua]